MNARLIRTFFVCIPLIAGALPWPCMGEEPVITIPFDGEINANMINVRSDSTTGSDIICSVNRGEPVNVIGQLYDWYKIRIPKGCPSYIKKTLVAPLDDKTIKVLKDRVNIRLKPDEKGPIIGKANTDEVLTVVGSAGDWFKIEPIAASYGWVNKKFVHPFRTGIAPAQPPQATAEHIEETKQIQEKNPPVVEDSQQGTVTAQGVVEPYGKVINRQATHKLVVKDTAGYTKIFLLKGSKSSLNALNFRFVKVVGKTCGVEPQSKYPIIEVTSIQLQN
ncbi:MAG TPA: SH3 domain-containing protein [Candidatus Omnitrophota bacterium]|nr:SH3 domain-containing protein [Candidatus Omnitrophota bacterium]HPT07645.1 SH3 domain-containing protein [Candidatus Omnitrophota bacterium]